MAVDYARDVRPILDFGLGLANVAASRLEGPAGAAASALVALLRLGVDLAAAGLDVPAHVERIHAADPALRDAESAWAAALREKFGEGVT